MTQLQVQYTNHMGNDDSVVNAARVSFAKEASNFPAEKNHKLIRYLAEHKHEIPFAHTAVTLRVKAPIFIRTQCFKHKIGFVENELLLEVYQSIAQECLEAYESMVKNGVAVEQARLILPQGVMTEWVWTGSLLAFARFYNLRTDPHAQKEIQDLAHMVGDIIEPLYPVSWAALTRARHG